MGTHDSETTPKWFDSKRNKLNHCHRLVDWVDFRYIGVYMTKVYKHSIMFARICDGAHVVEVRENYRHHYNCNCMCAFDIVDDNVSNPQNMIDKVLTYLRKSLISIGE